MRLQINIPTSIFMNIDKLVAVTYFQRLILEIRNLELFLLHLCFSTVNSYLNILMLNTPHCFSHKVYFCLKT